MAKLPYTFTICPDEPTPKSFTALTPRLVKALQHGYDMTIDQRQYLYPSSKQGVTRVNTHKEKKE